MPRQVDRRRLRGLGEQSFGVRAVSPASIFLGLRLGIVIAVLGNGK